MPGHGSKIGAVCAWLNMSPIAYFIKTGQV